MVGEAGDDLIDHIGGVDEVSGGEGNDVLSFSDLDNPFTLRFLDASGAQTGASFDLSTGGLIGLITGVFLG